MLCSPSSLGLAAALLFSTSSVVSSSSLGLAATLLFSASTGLAHAIPKPAIFPEIAALFAGNEVFRADIEVKHPGLLAGLNDNGQKPTAYVLSCSDSRVAVDTVLNAQPGTAFTDRNIANQFPLATNSRDGGASTVLTYGIEHLAIKHLIVVGHIGCGGVGAAIANAPSNPTLADIRVENWISPIRRLFHTSAREEIVAFREATSGNVTVPFPDNKAPAFVALVEENVKMQVANIAADPIVMEKWLEYLAKSTDQTDGSDALWVHGWVYDIADGAMRDLNISRGPTTGFTEEKAEG